MNRFSRLIYMSRRCCCCLLLLLLLLFVVVGPITFNGVIREACKVWCKCKCKQSLSSRINSHLFALHNTNTNPSTHNTHNNNYLTLYDFSQVACIIARMNEWMLVQWPFALLIIFIIISNISIIVQQQRRWWSPLQERSLRALRNVDALSDHKQQKVASLLLFM